MRVGGGDLLYPLFAMNLVHTSRFIYLSFFFFFITQILAYTGNDDGRKFFLDGDVTLDKIKVVSLSYHFFMFTFSH